MNKSIALFVLSIGSCGLTFGMGCGRNQKPYPEIVVAYKQGKATLKTLIDEYDKFVTPFAKRRGNIALYILGRGTTIDKLRQQLRDQELAEQIRAQTAVRQLQLQQAEKQAAAKAPPVQPSSSAGIAHQQPKWRRKAVASVQQIPQQTSSSQLSVSSNEVSPLINRAFARTTSEKNELKYAHDSVRISFENPDTPVFWHGRIAYSLLNARQFNFALEQLDEKTLAAWGNSLVNTVEDEDRRLTILKKLFEAAQQENAPKEKIILIMQKYLEIVSDKDQELEVVIG